VRPGEKIDSSPQNPGDSRPLVVHVSLVSRLRRSFRGIRIGTLNPEHSKVNLGCESVIRVDSSHYTLSEQTASSTRKVRHGYLHLNWRAHRGTAHSKNIDSSDTDIMCRTAVGEPGTARVLPPVLRERRNSVAFSESPLLVLQLRHLHPLY
jgi:hypothetical protein